jgi:small subunit ribosomal protein S11e
MATELAVQSEKAFQKQPHIFQNPKVKTKSFRSRWYKNVGLGFRTPKAAIEGSYIGMCPPRLVEAVVPYECDSFGWLLP